MVEPITDEALAELEAMYASDVEAPEFWEELENRGGFEAVVARLRAAEEKRDQWCREANKANRRRRDAEALRARLERAEAALRELQEHHHEECGIGNMLDGRLAKSEAVLRDLRDDICSVPSGAAGRAQMLARISGYFAESAAREET